MVSSLAQLGGNGSPLFADDNSSPLYNPAKEWPLPALAYIYISQSQKDGERENIAFAPSATAAVAATAVAAVATAATVILLQYTVVLCTSTLYKNYNSAARMNLQEFFYT